METRRERLERMGGAGPWKASVSRKRAIKFANQLSKAMDELKAIQAEVSSPAFMTWTNQRGRESLNDQICRLKNTVERVVNRMLEHGLSPGEEAVKVAMDHAVEMTHER